ncbi:MAG: glycosyltransferase family 2 protein [Candidatus Omnitrophota bacterium]
MQKNEIISIIVPLYNEAKNINILYKELLEASKLLDSDFEIILVNDGSKDNTISILADLYNHKGNTNLKIVTFIKRFGQTQAIQAGIDKAQGNIIVLIDGDLQNEPKDIPLLINKLKQGWDLVNGWRRLRKGPFFSKSLPSLAANMIIRRFTGIDLHDVGCGLKVFKRKVLEGQFFLGSIHRFFPLQVALKGYKVGEVIVSHKNRIYERSKYGWLRIYEVVLDMFRMQFFEKYFSSPLYYFGIPAFILLGIGVFLGIFVIVREAFFGGDWLSPLFFISIILFFLGIQIFLLGIIAEVLVRIFLRDNEKKPYIIQEFKE